MQKNKGFTLAEILITLFVIGVVAVLTIPQLIQSYEEIQVVTQLRKTYNIMLEAFKLSELENGKMNTTGLAHKVGVANYFIPYLQIAKDCKFTENGCFGAGDYTSPAGVVFHASTQPNSAEYPNYYKVLLTDGSAVGIWTTSQNCESTNAMVYNTGNCGWMYIDVNGPNPQI